MTPEAFTAFLHRNIPLTAAVGVTVVRCGAGEVELRAPLAPNLNHHGTAFGGSLALLGVVGGWSLMHHELENAGVATRLVVRKSECEFLRPGTAELVVSSRLPPQGWTEFLETLAGKGRARLPVETTITTAGVVAVKHLGVYFATLIPVDLP